MLTLDSLSCIKELSSHILRGQFQDVLTVMLRKDFVQMIGNSSSLQCRQCAYGTEGEPDNFMISEHTLVLVNRCLVHQLHAIVTDNWSQLYLTSLLSPN